MAVASPQGHELLHAVLAMAQSIPALAQTSHAGTGGPQVSAAAAPDSGPHMSCSKLVSAIEKRMSEPVTRFIKLLCSAAQMLGANPVVAIPFVSSLKL